MHETGATGSSSHTAQPALRCRTRLLAGALTLLFVQLSAVVAPPSAVAATACPDAFFIGVRGSGDALDVNRGMGPSVEPVYDSFVADLPSLTVEPLGLDYTAVPIDTGARTGGILYKESVSEGATRLEREVGQRLNRCPVTPLVMAGHSQGAHVIDRYMTQAGSPESPNIVGVALLGDPTRFPSRPYNADPNPPGGGLFHVPGLSSFRGDTVPPVDYWGLIDSYCIPGDPVCAGGPRRNLDVGGDLRLVLMIRDSTHSSYGSTGVSARAGTTLADRVAAVLAATRPPSGTLGPRIRNTSIAATGIASTSSGQGYWVTRDEGGVDAIGDAPVAGSMSGRPLNAPIVGISPSRTGTGYWLVGGDGGVFAYGDAQFTGSLADERLNAPVVGIAGMPSGRGYRVAAADGGVFAFGDASFDGSMADRPLDQPVVGIAANPSGAGYWLTAADGGVFAFGDAPFAGSVADQDLNAPVVGIASTPTGNGYWLAASDGGVFAFGDAPFLGSGVDRAVTSAVVGIAANPTAPGYWLTTSDGSVYGFGDAPLYDD